MQGMTKRDRTLLTVLLLAAVIFLIGYYVIRPTIQNNKALQTEIAAAEVKKAELEEKILQLPALRTRFDETLEKYNEEVSYFYPPMESQAIERMLTEIALERGMFCDTFNIEIVPEPLYLAPYLNSALRASEDGKSGLPGISCASLKMQVWGSYEQCQELLDYMILQNPALRMKSYAWEQNSIVTRNEDGSVKGTFDELTMDMELYMYEARG